MNGANHLDHLQLDCRSGEMGNTPRGPGMGTILILLFIAAAIVATFFLGFWGSQETQTIGIVPTAPVGQ